MNTEGSKPLHEAPRADDEAPAIENESGSELYAKYRAQRVFGSLDGLRALSILAVLWHHVLLNPPWVRDVLPGTEFGFLGVDLFFVLSGFLIVTLISRERDRTGTISLRNFYIRRSLRIFPLYYGLIAVFCVLYFVLRPHGAGASEFRRDLPYLVLYLSNWVPVGGMMRVSWSLAAEEQFYFLWPPVERFARRGAVPLLLVLIVLSQLIHLRLIDGFLESAFGWSYAEPTMLRQTTFTPILLGVLIAHLLHRPETFDRVAKVLAPRAVAPVLLAVLFVMAQFLPHDISGVPRLAVHLVMALLVASTVVREDHGLAPLLRLRPLVRIGELSYGIYLLHGIALGIANKLFEVAGVHPPFGDLVLGGALTWVIAELSFRFYESPFLRLKDRLSAARETKHS